MDYSFESIRKHGWPTWLTAIFPMTVIFYRPKTPRPRKKLVGWDGELAPPGSLSKYKYKPRYGRYKKQATTNQNIYSYAAACLMGPSDYMPGRRSLKHKGYSKTIALIYSTPEEIARLENSWRYIFTKYKSVWEIYSSRGVYTPEMLDLIERLDKEYPSKSSGQLRLW